MSDFNEMLEVEPTREVVCADCLEHMRTMPSGCVDAVITDPPYGLSFMDADWDTFGKKCGTESIEERKSNEYLGDNAIVPRFANDHGKAPKLDDMRGFQSAMAPVFAEALRVSKPGAHLLCFGGTRTYHRMACAIEDAGWEIRDCVMWVYGSGMPHGQNVAKMAAKKYPGEAESWEGWNTQLKPAWNPIILARKPLDGTVAKNALVHGTGAINVDACRVETDERLYTHGDEGGKRKAGNAYGTFAGMEAHRSSGQEIGRYPANLVHDGSQEVLDLFPDSKGQQGAIKGTEPSRTGEHGIYGTYGGARTPNEPRSDSGSAARFFYCAKATRRERGEGNDHPTVKPLALMEWLVKLVTRDDALVLDPFAGSGSTLIACDRLGREFIGIERDPRYCEIARHRLEAGDSDD